MKYFSCLLICLAFYSCKTPESITTTNESFRFVEREIRDTTLPGFTVQTEISLPEFLERRIYDTLKIIDPRTKGELLLWKNKYGELVAECTSQDQTITKLHEKIKDIQSRESETVIAVDPRNWWQKLMDIIPWYAYLIVGFLSGIILRIRFF
jgi:Uma2 family endonuclease